MALTYGFYDSVSNDRVYNAHQMGSIFDGIILDGIMETVGNQMQVVQDSGMNILVGSGRAWFKNTWTLNDSSLSLTVSTADALLNRIDIVYIEMNFGTGVRANSIAIMAGTPASSPVPPTLTQSGDVWQYPLAHIYVGAGVTSIYTANITSKIGTDDCPFVTGPISGNFLDHDHSTDHGGPLVEAGLGTGIVTETKIGNLAVTSGKLGASSVIAGKIATGGVSATAQLANDIVDDTKAGNRIIKLTRRQGGSSTVWGTSGSTNYTPTAILQQLGAITTSIVDSGNYENKVITFPVAFAYGPIGFLTKVGSNADDWDLAITAIDTTTMTVRCWNNSAGIDSLKFHWLAIGQG